MNQKCNGNYLYHPLTAIPISTTSTSTGDAYTGDTEDKSEIANCFKRLSNPVMCLFTTLSRPGECWVFLPYLILGLPAIGNENLFVVYQPLSLFW